MKHKTLRKKNGGAVISEGGTSIILYPAIKCKNKKNLKNYVTKIPKKGYHSLSSIDPKIINLLKKIDPKQKYFYYPERCEVDDETIEENKEYNITKDNIEILKKGKEIWFDWNDRKERTKEQLQHLRKAIDLLHANKIVHGDLWGSNVVIGDDDLPRIIDFSDAVYNSPEDYIEEEERLIEKGWPTLDAYKMFPKNTPEKKRIDRIRRNRRDELLKTQRKILK